MNWWQRIHDRLRPAPGPPALDALLANAHLDRPLAERVDWAEDLFAWLRRDVPATRLRLFLQLLERQPDARDRFAQTLRSLVRDTQALDLFADTGLPRGAAFMHELWSRVMARILPAPPDTRDLADIFDRLFPDASDARWLEQLDADLAQRVVALFQVEGNDPKDWSGLNADLEDALVQLSDRICVVGSGREVRCRLANPAFRELPFQRLPPALEALLQKRRAGAPLPELAAELNQVRALMDACERAVEEVIGHLEKTGINTNLVYDIARLRSQLRRLELLLVAWAEPDQDALRRLAMLADLVRQNHSLRSVTELFRQNLHLLTRRIVERNAETGEHYVARTREEYLSMLRRAAGGGALTGVTTIVKLLLGKLALAQFFQGAFYGVNYAVSFVAIQLCGFTLATKQPANTAPALARRMGELQSGSQLEALVDEVVVLIRSQFAAICGNLALVVPATLFLSLVYFGFTGHHIAEGPKAEAILASVAPRSGCWLFAAFTGVLLWTSSLIAAWSENWFVLHRLGPALAQHRRLLGWLGPTRARRLAHWLEHNIAGLAGNVSLGFMLGLVPEMAGFFGLPLDVRHVTLSTGQVAAAYAALGLEGFLQITTLGTFAGLVGIGALNVAVSFGLALLVAMRAGNVHGPERNLFFRALFRRVLRAPLTFVLPARADRA